MVRLQGSAMPPSLFRTWYHVIDTCVVVLLHQKREQRTSAFQHPNNTLAILWYNDFHNKWRNPQRSTRKQLRFLIW